jgi:sulfonate transport system permease protein
MSSIGLDGTIALPAEARVSRRPGPRRAVTLAGQIATGLILPATILVIWQLAVHYRLLAPQILPAPALVWETTIDLILSGEMLSELAVSFGRVAAGLAVGGSLGLLFGIAFALSRSFEAYVAPTVRAICLVPSLGWLPFFMLIFGIGEALKIVLIAKTCFLPLMVHAFEAIRALPAKYQDVARVLELGRFKTIRFIVVPAVLPAIATGFRLALSKGWKALILVEMISSAAGIGHLMMWGRKSFQLDVVFATMIVIGLVGWVLDRGVLILQNRTTRWSFYATQ